MKIGFTTEPSPKATKYEYREYTYWWRRTENGRRRQLLSRIKKRAKVAGYKSDLELSDIDFPVECPVLKVPIDYTLGEGHKKYGPSIDRIDNTKGYMKGNIQIISEQANRIKTNSTVQELQLFAEWVIRTYGISQAHTTDVGIRH